MSRKLLSAINLTKNLHKGLEIRGIILGEGENCCWVLGAGYWVLVACCWLLVVAGCLLLVTGYWLKNTFVLKSGNYFVN